MKRIMFIAGVVLVMASPSAFSSAMAFQTEVPLGSRIARPIATNPLDQEDEGKVRDAFTKCIIEKEQNNVLALLAHSDPQWIDYDDLGYTSAAFGRKFRLDRCLSKATSVTDTGLVLKMSPQIFRAMVMEEAYRSRFPTPPAWLSSMPKDNRRVFLSPDELRSTAMETAAFADCLVAAAPMEADALLRTPYKSKAEQAAVKPLIPYLGPCILEGQTVKFQVPSIRNFVAEGLWQAGIAADSDIADKSAVEAER